MAIEAFYGPLHILHDPPHEIYDGEKEPYPDVADRVVTIVDAIKKTKVADVYAAKEQSESFIRLAHSAEYIAYLKNLSETTRDWTVPSIFPISDVKPTHDGALFGYYSFETATPVGKGTYAAAKNAADVVVTGVEEILRGQKTVYAITRPPGHHAEREKMGGYCYFNNAAIGALILSRYGKVAVLDVDAHHFNGTQKIFYERPDVFTVSIHGDPSTTFPYFTGYATEKGSGYGLGYNLNIPVNPEAMDDSAYDVILQDALYAIKQFSPRFLVVSIGFDTHINDPIGRFRLTTKYYKQIGNRVQALNCPILLVQEGGYNIDTIGLSAVSLLRGFQRNHIVAINFSITK